jgi:hypothetical protein
MFKLPVVVNIPRMPAPAMEKAIGTPRISSMIIMIKGSKTIKLSLLSPYKTEVVVNF